MSERIDVSIEHRHAPAEDGGKPHPNTCPKCGSHYRDDELAASLYVCTQCGHHFPVHARDRITQLTDEDSFVEEAAELRSDDPLEFFDLRPYTERLSEAELSTGLGEAMVIGRAAIEEQPCQLAVMEFGFMGGSMGRVVGEKFARACEGAAERGVPLVSVTTTGGARMQEGILSLMQLPKTVCAVEDLHDAGGTLISVMAHPDDRRRARELRQPRRRARGRAGRAALVHRPAGRAADDAREAARRLRPRGVQLPPRPRRRDRPPTRAARRQSRAS